MSSILLDEIERQMDSLPEEAKEQLAELLKERAQPGSVYEKLKESADCMDAANILLMNKTRESMKKPCYNCGIRDLCAHYRENCEDQEIKNCAVGIAKTLDGQFRWGEVFYDALDKYGPEYVEMMKTEGLSKLFGGQIEVKVGMRQKGDLPFKSRKQREAELAAAAERVKEKRCGGEAAQGVGINTDDSSGTTQGGEAVGDSSDSAQADAAQKIGLGAGVPKDIF